MKMRRLCPAQSHLKFAAKPHCHAQSHLKLFEAGCFSGEALSTGFWGADVSPRRVD
ncbi:MAG: hypothetical protein IJS15_03825 [Victivallales bacterium]|nr:hypothetical protein [Victivallales bacterium]